MKKVVLLLPIAFVLITSCKSSQSTATTNTLEGTWQLNYITGPRIAFGGLYPEKKPTITFDLKENRVSGDNSCNNYSGNLIVKGNQINFKDSKMIATMMACPGQGEQVFMSTLNKIETYSISEDGKTLNFIMGDIAMMRFEKVLTDTHNSQNSLDWQGTYKGTTPCADCEGIATEITLNTDLTFSLKTKYLGKGDGKVFEEKGTFVWDKSGSTITLTDLKGKPNQYKVGENRLIQLDMNGKIITGALAEKYVLTK
ncbi:copper resistance protein NlpE N-terminal domain-containing protein [Flavobacterium sp. RSB2_4_14]|uniref:copper resistance protein NlpE N-terminal domain-containing protein n=1 Tax=Flavobacterium sp. RSB2_4_14 TaxID=3447665 RepID=UPI003F3406AD